MKLFCLRVGATADPFSVETQPHDTIEKLKELVIAKTKLKKKHSPQDIKLFLAKRDGQWLSADSEEVKALQRGDVEAIFDLLDTALNPMKEVLEVFQDVQERVLHVLVVEERVAEKLLIFRLSASAFLRSEARRKRWRDLNEKLGDVGKRVKTFSSSDLSDTEEEEEEEETKDRSVWRAVKQTLRYDEYSPKRKPIPKEHMDFLYQYLTDYVSAVMNRYDGSLDKKCRLFIAPMLSMICRLFDDAKLEIDKTVMGRDVHADARFEFTITRGSKKKVCFLVAKKNDFFTGAAKALVGCEAVADTTELPVVYGIVTDFVQWETYRFGEESILHTSAVIQHDVGLPDYASTAKVCEMIYALLSDDDDEQEKVY